MAYIYLQGTIEWAHHLFIPDEYEGIKKWKVNFYPDEKSRETLTAAGSKKKFKLGAYGEYTSLTREVEKEFKRGDGPKPLAPVDIRTAEGEAWPEGKAIGNGSKATVKVEIYEAGRMGKGTRLAGVRIDELVEYERPAEQLQANHDILPF